VFLTTHYLDEADALSDRIVIIDHGRIVASDTADNLKAAVAGDLVELEVATLDQVSLAAEKLATLVGCGGDGGGDGSGDGVEVDGHHVSGRVRQAGRAVPGLLRDLDRTGVALSAIEVRRPTLDDVFLDLTGRSLRES
jgi:ABC-2 type transport system ATP-binding protein